MDKKPSGSRGRRLGPNSAIPAIVKLIRRLFFSVSMEIEVTSMGKQKRVKLKEGATGEDLLHALNLLPDGVLIVNRSVPIPYTSKLKDGDKLKVIRVASGG